MSGTRWTQADLEAAKARGITIDDQAPTRTATALMERAENRPQSAYGEVLAQKPVKTAKRVRQGEKPMNKLEAEFGRIIEPLAIHLRAQSKRYRLANGVWYKPDWTGDVFSEGCPDQETCWEVKGGKGMKGHAKSMLTLKVAASTWPHVDWILAWKENGQWQTQKILP